jgi:predicted lipid carrier protein YhbT
MSDHDNTSEASHLEKARNVRISMNMTPREAFNFVLKLSSDDEFRSRLEMNPHEVLAEHHIHIPSKDIPLHASLPPKDALQQVLMDLMAGREGTITALPLNVDPMYWMFIDFFIFLAHRQST